MNTRRLTLAAFAALFAVSSSVAMLQSARPAVAAQSWNHSAHIQRVDRDDRHVKHDRDDRRARHDRDDHRRNYANNGNHNGWNNPHNPHYNGGKRRHVAVSDRH